MSYLIKKSWTDSNNEEASKLEHVKDGKVHKNLVKISRYVLLVYTSALACTLGCLAGQASSACVCNE